MRIGEEKGERGMDEKKCLLYGKELITFDRP